MKLKKTVGSFLLLTIGVGLLAPTVIQATEIGTVTSEELSVSVRGTEATVEGTTELIELPTSQISKEEVLVEEALPEAAYLDSEEDVLEGIVGKDDQYRITATTADPYRKIVRLELIFDSENYVGSGTMISPDTIITAAHNVYDYGTGTWADEIIVYPAKNGEEIPYGRHVAKVFYTMRDYTTAKDKTTRRANDIALIKLDSPVDVAVGALPVTKSISKTSRIQVAGYPAATESKDSYLYTMFGGVVDLTDTMIEYTIDTEGGQSGGPVLNEQNEIVGVHIIGRKKDGVYYQNAARRVKDDTFRMIDISQNGLPTTPEIASNIESTTGIIYRMYNPATTQYFYTRSLNEARVLELRGWRYEGRAFATTTAGEPVYRFYNASRKAYLYSKNVSERDDIVKKGWKYEGIAWYSGGNRKVHRFYNPSTSTHIYTANAKEVNLLRSRGWKYEGVAFYTL